jgi:hypothetical protein
MKAVLPSQSQKVAKLNNDLEQANQVPIVGTPVLPVLPRSPTLSQEVLLILR